jgi:methylthioribulose-1-phosphate dehydratase
MVDFPTAAGQLAQVGRRLDARGWVLGTSGNLSVVVSREPLRLAVTPSGAFKGDLTPEAIVEVDADGTLLGTPTGGRRPSAETLVHVAIARARSAGAILHTHSVWATVLSAKYLPDAGISIEGYEMLKGLEGVSTHEHREWIPIIENDQDMARLSDRVSRLLAQHPACHAFLLRRHGLYAWGETLPQALRHVEIVEFLLEAVGRTADRS